MIETVFGLKTRQDACPHHWRIGTPSGETSSAICLMCGASRRFKNYTQGSYMALGRRRSHDAKASK
jgi:hypothetical protein